MKKNKIFLYFKNVLMAMPTGKIPVFGLFRCGMVEVRK